jgi:hypothetical protein
MVAPTDVNSNLQRVFYLRNDVDPTQVTSASFRINEDGFFIQAVGLGAGESLTFEYFDTTAMVWQSYAPPPWFTHDPSATAFVMTQHTPYVILRYPGLFRLALPAVPTALPVVVIATEVAKESLPEMLRSTLVHGKYTPVGGAPQYPVLATDASGALVTPPAVVFSAHAPRYGTYGGPTASPAEKVDGSVWTSPVDCRSVAIYVMYSTKTAASPDRIEITTAQGVRVVRVADGASFALNLPDEDAADYGAASVVVTLYGGATADIAWEVR